MTEGAAAAGGLHSVSRAAEALEHTTIYSVLRKKRKLVPIALSYAQHDHDMASLNRILLKLIIKQFAISHIKMTSQ